MVITLHKTATSVAASVNYITKKIEAGDSRIISYANVDVADGNIIGSLQTEFDRLDIANIRSDKVSFHASINPTPEELDKIDIKEIAKEFMNLLGYGEQPYLVVEHSDIGRTHYHIISHRITPEGKKIKSSFEKRRINAFVKELNRRLQSISHKESNEGIVQYPGHDNFKFDISKPKKYIQIRQIFNDACKYQYTSVFELQKILLDRNVELIEQDGHYVAAGIGADGRQTKAIAVDSGLIRSAQRCVLTYAQKMKMRNMAIFALEHSVSQKHAERILAKKGIGIQFLKNDDGKIYGVYFIDHIGKTISKASDIYKGISAKAWREVSITRWRDYKDQLQSMRLDLNGRVDRHPNCLNLRYAGNYLFHTNNTLSEIYKDLKYSRQRDHQRRII